MVRNVELMKGVRDQLVSNPDQHDQTIWLCIRKLPQDLRRANLEKLDSVGCATAACGAGWACLLSGDKAVVGPYHGYNRPMAIVDTVISSDTDRERNISSRARDLLGITNSVARTLFDPDNTTEEVVNALNMLIEGKTNSEVINYLEGKYHG